MLTHRNEMHMHDASEPCSMDKANLHQTHINTRKCLPNRATNGKKLYFSMQTQNGIFYYTYTLFHAKCVRYAMLHYITYMYDMICDLRACRMWISVMWESEREKERRAKRWMFWMIYTNIRNGMRLARPPNARGCYNLRHEIWECACVHRCMHTW